MAGLGSLIPELDEVLARMMARDPSHRPTALEACSWLSTFASPSVHTTCDGAQPPTEAINKLTQGQAAPSGGQPPTAALSQEVQGQTPGPGASSKTADASAALARARDADRQGKEADCMKALDEAKQLVRQ